MTVAATPWSAPHYTATYTLSAPIVRATTCTPAPSTFNGTKASFSSVCTVRYCPAPNALNMVWSGNDGPVTRAEVESALGMLSSVPPATTNGIGNIFSNGAVGQAAYGAGLLYETTGDIRALDLALKIADNMLALRNSPATGTVVWGGESW